ncbi:Rne/Rng family ribonuclease [Rossellomorea vietnamensis]|uniref:Rne/Rng family ribonuclease n=1 Tax=Rossellomorea vietnamensis TaxID=218284 RepID=UPI001CCC7434|nr:Rne/Rng family ribonuclease [Rossellomorea vietnamensis]MCA0147442.1 Rne/Rng family ribonuclease [Rossellomorea vietnamensis]
MEEMIVHSKGREKRWVHRSHNEIIGLYTYPPGEESLTGNIYLGRVIKVQKGLGAAFVDFGQGKNGYLHEKDFPQNVKAYHEGSDPTPIGNLVHEGEKVIVQVLKDEMGTKGARLTAVIELKGEHLVYMPKGYYVAVSKKVDDENRKVLRRLAHEWKQGGEGIVMRTNASGVKEAVLQEEVISLRTRYEGLERVSLRAKCPSPLSRQDTFYEDLHEYLKKGGGGKIVFDEYDSLLQVEEMSGEGIRKKWNFDLYQGSENIFKHYDVSSAWESALKKIVWLPNGATLIIEATEAMTVVDVNSGKFTGKDNLEQTILETNKLAAAEMAKQLTIRNLSGMILIDFIDMKKDSHRQEVMDALSEALISDRQRTTIVGFTKLGILELTRKRTRQPLAASLTRPCSVCHGTGREMSPETMAFKLERELWECVGMDGSRIEVEATRDVADSFAGKQGIHIERLQKVLNKKIVIQEITHTHPYFRITKIL